MIKHCSMIQRTVGAVLAEITCELQDLCDSPAEQHIDRGVVEPHPRCEGKSALAGHTFHADQRDVYRILAARKGLARGDVRLVASLNEPLPGMDVDPVASQSTRAAVLVVANLRHEPLAEPQADYNSRQDPPPDLRDQLDPEKQ